MFSLRRFFPLLLLLGMLAAAPAWASLQDEIDSMFDSMSNVTAPTSVMDQRRGLLAGGQYSLRSKVMDVQLLSVLPPSADMGCNGLDLFGGSFSFISADQFIQLLRTIAANASGYAFKMALQAMCPSCDSIMSNLQAIAQKLNDTSISSCQAAKEIVSAATFPTPAVLKTASNATSAGLARVTGAVSEGLQSWFPSTNDNKTPAAVLTTTSNGRAAMDDMDITGNVIWKALNETSAETWWGAGDKAFLEAVMSVTGSVIIRPPKAGENEFSFTQLPPILKLSDFMRGTTGTGVITVYRCLNSQCYNANEDSGPVTNPVQMEINLSNFTEKVSLTARNIVGRFMNNTMLSSDQQAFMELAPASIGALLRNLALTNRGMAMLYTEQAAPVIAQIMSAHLMLEMIRTATIAVSQSTSDNAAQIRHQLLSVANQVREESASIQSGMASLQELIGTYKSMLDVTEKRRLGLDKLVFKNNRAMVP